MREHLERLGATLILTLIAFGTAALLLAQSTVVTVPKITGVPSQGGTFASSTFTGNSTFTGQILAADGTAPLPAYSFASNPDTGGYISGSQLRWSVDGVLVAALSATNFGVFGSGMYYGFPNGSRLAEGAAGNFTFNNAAATIGSQLKVDALPTIASGFGTSPAVIAGSTPLAGAVNVGTGAVATSGTITFGGTAFPATPFCILNANQGSGVQSAVATTTTLQVFTSVAWPASTQVAWICISPK